MRKITINVDNDNLAISGTQNLIKQLEAVLKGIEILETRRQALFNKLAQLDLTQCDNCGAIRDHGDLQVAENLLLRVDAGGEMPAGQCPDCGALAYRIDIEK